MQAEFWIRYMIQYGPLRRIVSLVGIDETRIFDLYSNATRYGYYGIGVIIALTFMYMILCIAASCCMTKMISYVLRTIRSLLWNIMPFIISSALIYFCMYSTQDMLFNTNVNPRENWTFKTIMPEPTNTRGQNTPITEDNVNAFKDSMYQMVVDLLYPKLGHMNKK